MCLYWARSFGPRWMFDDVLRARVYERAPAHFWSLTSSFVQAARDTWPVTLTSLSLSLETVLAPAPLTVKAHLNIAHWFARAPHAHAHTVYAMENFGLEVWRKKKRLAQHWLWFDFCCFGSVTRCAMCSTVLCAREVQHSRVCFFMLFRHSMPLLFALAVCRCCGCGCLLLLLLL